MWQKIENGRIKQVQQNVAKSAILVVHRPLNAM
jgi:hypothetical protein